MSFETFYSGWELRKKKLFGSWQKTSDASSTDATLLLHNVLKAFRFPDESQIYLKCDIEVRILDNLHHLITIQFQFVNISPNRSNVVIHIFDLYI